MPFGLTMGTERANALQQSIQDELTRRGYAPDADLVMAEYITIMVINNKSAGKLNDPFILSLLTPRIAQITAELEDCALFPFIFFLLSFTDANFVRSVVIGSEYDPAFTDWLFAEAAKGTTGSEIPLQPQPPTPSAQPNDQLTPREPPPHASRDAPNRAPHSRSDLYQQTVSQATTSGSAQKRSASVRSPSPTPGHPNKSRRTDLPTGPRAMQREGGSERNPRSLLDRMGGHAGPNKHQRDDIQARIDNITSNSSEPNMMMGGGFPGMPMGGMDMNAMAMANPLMLQEMFMSNMALMQQLSTQIGVMQGFVPPGFNPQGGVPGDMGMFPGGQNSNGNNFNQGNRGRGSGRGGRGAGRGRGGSHAGASSPSKPSDNTSAATDTMTSTTTTSSTPSSQVSPAVVAPSATPAPSAPAPSIAAPVAIPATTTNTPQLPYAVPERPQSPTLCKFGLKCTNVHCRWSHPSPVATPESGVVLSNEACENGKNCKDKDCIKAHVSPAVLSPSAQTPIPAPASVIQHPPSNPTPCRFGLACTRPNCMFSHPRPASNPQHATPCRFGSGCTRATCPYQHTEGRVLPTSFHRGLSAGGPMVNVPAPETGSMGPSPHRSVTFNNPKAKLDKQVKGLEERKIEAEKAIKEAQAAANAGANTNGTEELKPVATAA
ncbi:Nuclear polyadenylated RNA-binding protein nab2 [Leucoagaricus sp. SymC.cos]|nr:Nuclear polyadenylated RNA-binding protein nab2 [Leucoagaricus sp. SymC.cos]